MFAVSIKLPLCMRGCHYSHVGPFLQGHSLMDNAPLGMLSKREFPYKNISYILNILGVQKHVKHLIFFLCFPEFP